MGESYTPWLLRKSERDFFRLCLDYSDAIVNQAELLSKEVEHFLNEEWSKREGMHELILRKSKEVLKTKKQLIRQVSSAEVLPEHRVSLSRLIFSLSDISSYIDSTSYRLDLKNIALKGVLTRKIEKMMEETMRIVRKLHETIELMNKDLEKVIDNTNKISVMEDEIDALRRGIMKDLVNEPTHSDAPTFFVVAEILNSMETISDKIEKVSNILEVIAVSHLP